MTVAQIRKEILQKIENEQICIFKGMKKTLLLVSTRYPGIWLEHVFDSVLLAQLDSSKLYLAENTVELFLRLQKENGQLPCYIWDANRIQCPEEQYIGYFQIQECVSFTKLCYMIYEMNHDRAFLERTYAACQKWVAWQRANRMTTDRGLIELFCGFDTGHDYSGRWQGISCPHNYMHEDGSIENAAVLPPDDGITPMLAVDMNCTFYATLIALSKMADALSYAKESKDWKDQATTVKQKLFEHCYDANDAFFYDVDRHGNKRKYLSCTVFHLFMEGVLDREDDAELIREIYEKHITNPNEFATPYPYPSMAICDPSFKKHWPMNCWGYYSQANVAERATMWMEAYGFEKELDELCAKWVKAWTEHYDELKLGQELDPLTGVPSPCSEWYSPCMLFYWYATQRLKGRSNLNDAEAH